MNKYELKLNYKGKSVVLESGTLEYCNDMLKWYKRHNEFFNGRFTIEKLFY